MLKKAFSLLTIILFFTQGCYVEYYEQSFPQACFMTAYDQYSVGEPISFNNCSSNAYSYYWDFGDGTHSTEESPVHVYDRAGTYEVFLTAYRGDVQSVTSSYVDIVNNGSTELNILVTYYGTDDPVSNCSVVIYDNYDDWYNFTNEIASGFTNTQGLVIFSYLRPIEYYIDAYKKIDDNTFYSNENLGYKTDALVEATTNYYQIEVELLQNSSGKKSSQIKQIKPLSKQEFVDLLSRINQKIKEKTTKTTLP